MGQTLCFIEVKTRTSRNIATAESAVDDDKTRVLRRMARQYLQALPDDTGAGPLRRFVNLLPRTSKPADFELFPNAFHWR